jgi:phage terminase small subunit
MEEFATHEDALNAWQRHDWTVEQARFAAELLQHGNAARAWLSAYKDEANETEERFRHVRAQLEGNKIAALPFMVAYIKFLRAKIKEQMAVTPENVLDRISEIAHANFADFVVVDENGDPRFDASSLRREQWAAIQEMTIETYVEGRGEDAERVKAVKFKLAPKMGALDALGRNLKLFTDTVEFGNLDELADIMTSARRRRASRQKSEEEGSDDNGLSDNDD